MPEVRKPESNLAMIGNHEDRLRRVEAIASRAPSQSVGVELSNQFVAVTSSTFVPTCHWNLPAAYSEVLNAWVVVTTDTGTTAEVIVHEFYSGASSDPVVLGALANGYAQFEWLHGVHLGDTICEFQIRVRRTGGTGNVTVYSPRRFLLDTVRRFPDATEAGNPTFV